MARTLLATLLLWLGCQLTVVAGDEVLIDVRSAEEYATGHLDGALLMPHDRIDQLIRDANIAKDAPITLYCRSGRRSEMAKETLEKLGYTQVTNAGGYEELVQQRGQACAPGAC